MENFKRERILGRGSFGTVFLIGDCNEKKVLKEVAIQDDKQREMARQESSVLSQLDHPNIVRYLRSMEYQSKLLLLTEYCSGGDLSARVRKQRGVYFIENVIVNWFRQLCSAVAYLHERRILHRDIKTGNVFLCKGDSLVKLGDFGVARVLSHTEDMAKTCVGTPYYLSPEICERREYNSRSDIWGLGCVLYELMSLRPPFTGNLKELLSQITRSHYPAPPPRFSYELRNIVIQMLRKNPDERPAADSILRKLSQAAAPVTKPERRHPLGPARSAKINLKNLGNLAVYATGYQRHQTARKKSSKQETKSKAQPQRSCRRRWKNPSGTLISQLSSLSLMEKTYTKQDSLFGTPDSSSAPSCKLAYLANPATPLA